VSDYSKLLDHPDKDDIISKLLNGASPKEVSEWLKLKYDSKEQSHLRLPAKLLKDFIDENIDINNVIQQDIVNIKQEKQVSLSLKNNKTYQERLVEAADQEIDLRKMLKNLSVMITARMEQVFDKIQQNPENMKPDYALIKWCEMMLNFSEKYDKIVNHSPDKVVQHNITMQTIDNYTVIFQEAIKDVLTEMDPEFAFLFIEKLNEKLARIQAPKNEVFSPEKRLKEINTLSIKAESISGDDND
jgi:hypothetical protein